MLAKNDIADATRAAHKIVRDFSSLDEVRREVVIEMIYNLGPLKFMGFRKMLAALSRRDFSEAAKEMLASLWAQQVKGRALTLAETMKTGKFPE